MLDDMTVIETSALERETIRAGCSAAIAAMMRFQGQAVLELFVRTVQTEPVEPKLEALRAYAELRHALTPRGHAIDANSLLAAGYSVGQIAQFDRLILGCR